MRALTWLILLCSLAIRSASQDCNDWLKLSSTPSFAQSDEIDITGTKLTIEARFIRTASYGGGYDGAGDLVSKHSNASDISYLLHPNGAAVTTLNGYYKTPAVCEIELNKIYHVALVYDGITLQFYRNGFLLSEITATGNLLQNDAKTLIGFCEAQEASANFIGYIDEVRIWDYARSQALIRTYMDLPLPVPAAEVGLVAYYTFNNLSNKQTNSSYDLTLSPAGSEINLATADCNYLVDSCGVRIAPPDSIVISDQVPICAGSYYQVKTHPADSYQWSPTTYLDDPTSPMPVVNPPVSMTYYVDAFVAEKNAVIRDSVRIIVIRSDIKANEDTTVCAGSPVQMNVSQGTSFAWSPTAGLSDPQVPNPVATPLITTKYVVTGIGTTRCASSDTVVITVLPQPQVIVSNDTAVCRSATVQLNAAGGLRYEWFPATGLSDPLVANPIAKATATTMFMVDITGTNGCVKKDTVTIQVHTYPDFTTSGDQSVCEGDKVTLTASGGNAYQWMPANQVTDATAASTEALLNGPENIYSVHISEDVCNYDTTLTMKITTHPNPVVSILKNNDINCATPTAQLLAKGADSYFWTPFEYLDNATTDDPVAAVDTTTTFTVTGFTDAGCSATSSVTVKVDNTGTPRFVLPNAFTPNADGRNDCFGIRRWGNAKVHQFAIYNRWGQTVFQTKDPSQCWDGRTNGILQAPGGYIYIINATTFCGVVQRRGMFTLIR